MTVSITHCTVNAIATGELNHAPSPTNDSYELSSRRDRQLMMATKRERNEAMDKHDRIGINVFHRR